MKKYIVILIIIISIGFSLFVGSKLYFLGNQTEREKILSATVWQLSKEGYKENEIENIKVMYDPIKGGNIPYEVYVTFKKDTSTEQVYSWRNVDKKEIKNIMEP
ncbi:hypothetical protein Z968_10065 [Clostridium novyi A str. 4552]|uniref:DUF3139 domain-containing protein n=1 Tax=Clostridium novyi A str. 4552 TaxID=1444289 RepID=A0A0A0I2M0_CLONO|nr:DUF3139 domain-containing protein [Clostridium novyi]KGM95042.1 hypothetical protein Z968_10065 [Clostridium novyi A str. 4552]